MLCILIVVVIVVADAISWVHKRESEAEKRMTAAPTKQRVEKTDRKENEALKRLTERNLLRLGTPSSYMFLEEEAIGSAPASVEAHARHEDGEASRDVDGLSISRTYDGTTLMVQS